MTQYSGFVLKFKQENASSNTVIPTACLSVYIENKGDATLKVSIDNTDFWLEKGDALSFPQNGNNNPLLVLMSDIKLTFSDVGAKVCSLTKTVAEPSIITY